MQLLQCIASLSGGSGQWNCCNALPHCPWAVGSATPAMHCLTARGQWAVQLLQCTASLPSGQWAVQLLQCSASLAGGSVQPNSSNTLPHCPGAVGNGTPAIHCHTAWGQWAVELVQCTDCLTAWGQWAVQLLQCTASLPSGSRQCNSCNALPHCLWAVGSGTPAMLCPTAWGQWAAQLLQCTASLPGGSGHCNSRSTPPHCPGAVSSATPATHCLTAWGQWAVELLLLVWWLCVIVMSCGAVLHRVVLFFAVVLYGSFVVSWRCVWWGVVLRRVALGCVLVRGVGLCCAVSRGVVYCHAMLCVVAWRLVAWCSTLRCCVALFGCSFWCSVSRWRVCCFECLASRCRVVLCSWYVGCAPLLCHVVSSCCSLLCGFA